MNYPHPLVGQVNSSLFIIEFSQKNELQDVNQQQEEHRRAERSFDVHIIIELGACSVQVDDREVHEELDHQEGKPIEILTHVVDEVVLVLVLSILLVKPAQA